MIIAQCHCFADEFVERGASCSVASVRGPHASLPRHLPPSLPSLPHALAALHASQSGRRRVPFSRDAGRWWIHPSIGTRFHPRQRFSIELQHRTTALSAELELQKLMVLKRI